MKTKIVKILGVVLSLALLSSLAMVAAPVAAVGDPAKINTWAGITPPALFADTDIELITTAPDGTLFVSVYDDNTGKWTLWRGSADGFTWKKTAFKDSDQQIRTIACAPNWGAASKMVYVGPDAGWSL